ncbi:recombination and repair protein [compost metagenome]
MAKRRDKQATTSTVTALTPDSRVAEVGRMLGGERLSETTMAHAREMLQQACVPASKG